MNLISVRSLNVNLISPFKIRYFRFDFPRGINETAMSWKKNGTTYQFYPYRKVISTAAENVLFSEMDRRTGEQNIILSDEMHKLIEIITDYFDPILSQLYIINSSDYSLDE